MKRITAALAAMLFVLLLGACGGQTPDQDTYLTTTATAIPQIPAEPLMLRVERYDRAGPPTDEGGTYTLFAEKRVDADGTLHLEAQPGVHATVTVLSFDDEAVTVRVQAENMLSSRHLHELDPLPLEYSWEAEMSFGEAYSLDALLNGGHVRFIYTFTKN